MRDQRSIGLWVTSLFLVALVGCVADSRNALDTPASLASAQETGSQHEPGTGDVQERAVPRMGPGGALSPQPANPGLTTPLHPATPPTVTTSNLLSGQSLPPPSSPPPSVNIAAVANAIRYDYRSLSTILTTPPGLPLTNPVTISIGYFPSGVAGYGSYCRQRVTQTYVPSAGNTFFCALPEGDGRPRPLHLDITLSEPKPGGGQYSYNIPLDIPLDPLYDVTITPLIFTLIMGCSTVGANQIDLRWFAPDQATYQKVHFATQERETFTIHEFAWARPEVSAAANLHPVYVWYEETGFHYPPGFAPLPVPGGTLVPGKTYRSNQGLVRSVGGTTDCQATLDYTVTYAFRQYWLNLGATPNVPAHR